MKKALYTIAVLLTLSLSITSCTKEEIKPKTGNSSGGSASDRGF